MVSTCYHATPFQVVRWAAVIAILAAMTYLGFLLLNPEYTGLIKPDTPQAIDWLLIGPPIALLAILVVSAFLVRFFIFLHIAAFFATCSIPLAFIQKNNTLDFMMVPLCMWVLMYCHAVAMRREKKRLDLLSKKAIHDPQEIHDEIPCVYCGYVLKGLRSNSRCPECGRAVTPSMADQPLALYRPAWFWRVRLGATLFAFSLLLRLTVDFLFEHTKTFGWHPEIANYLYFFAVVLITLGAWFATSSENNNMSCRGTGCRIFLRIASVGYAAITWFFFIDFVLNQLIFYKQIPQSWAFNLSYLIMRYDTFEEIVYVMVEWLLAVYLYLLATRMISRAFMRHSMIAGFLVLLFIAAKLLVPLMDIYIFPSTHDILRETVMISLSDIPELYLAAFLLCFSAGFSRYYRSSLVTN